MLEDAMLWLKGLAIEVSAITIALLCLIAVLNSLGYFKELSEDRARGTREAE